MTDSDARPGPPAGRVVVLGSLNVDLVTRVERLPQPGETVLAESLTLVAGGKGANQAVAAAAAGADVVMVGRVGDDAAGEAYRSRLAQRGIDVTALGTAAGTPTGHALVTVDTHGENSIVVVPGANHAVPTDALATLDLQPEDVLLLQLEVPPETVAAAARAAERAGARVVINAAPFAWLPTDVVALADPLVVNEHEAVQLADSGLLPGSLCVTFGAGGATWAGELVQAEPVPLEEVVDTTGAGDAFCGALAAALAAGRPTTEVLAAAVAAGSAAVCHRGAQPDPEL